MSSITLSRLTAVLLCLVPLFAGAQNTRQNSPYSRFGIGDLNTTDFTAVQGNGGLSAVYANTFYLNVTNPAALGWLRYTALEVGGYFRTAEMSEKISGKTARSNDGGFGYLGLGFPINRAKLAIEGDTTVRKKNAVQWGMAFSLIPHSTIGYNIQVQDSLAGMGDVLFGYNGRGTHYQFMWSNGFRIRNWGFGAGIGYFFGRSNQTNRLFFLESGLQDDIYFPNFRKNENYNGLTYNVGARAEWTLNRKPANPMDPRYVRLLKHKFTTGLYGTGGNPVSVRSNTQYDRYNPVLGYDTIYVTNDTTFSKNLPMSFGAGFGFSKEHTWMAGANFEYSRWSTFSDNSADSWRAAIGAEWRPDSTSQENFFKSINYRVGLFYQTDPRKIAAEDGLPRQLRKYGATIGFEIPIYSRDKEQRLLTFPSYLNIALEAGKFGHPDLIDEFYFRLAVGFTLNDTGWFNRSKFR